ncbi:unnamed protein product [Phaedon cochleariae]|uniref:ER-bound oxygenase mpaB/mpaB'/Rubber oxygenase catalytic domain-containing protein n=1 Tax=Phaedon cochleariae TaxID=80249 RepID=A0A9P0GVT4_PHACE|nr:unnamed protein product [Phaedon cochleariae]
MNENKSSFNSDGVERNDTNFPEFSAEKFVDELLTEGEKFTCDETSDSYNDHFEIPPFYDESLYKKGQDFIHNNITSFLVTSLFGLLALGCRPTLKLLILTQKSCTPLKAYKRYLATNLYMQDWYNHDFKPGSKSWRALGIVRKMHNSASKLGHQKLDYRINQMEMAITQFGFIGFAVVRGKYIGLYEASEEDLKGVIHLWRVIGYALGIEDRFNICRESVKETKEIFEELLKRVFIPGMQQIGEDYYDSAEALVGGLQGMTPGLRLDVLLHLLHMVMDGHNDITKSAKDHLAPLDESGLAKLKLLMNIQWAMQYRVFRFFIDKFYYSMIWCWRNFPIAAYWKFGIKDAKIKI